MATESDTRRARDLGFDAHIIEASALHGPAAELLNRATGRTVVIFPGRGLIAVDRRYQIAVQMADVADRVLLASYPGVRISADFCEFVDAVGDDAARSLRSYVVEDLRWLQALGANDSDPWTGVVPIDEPSRPPFPIDELPFPLDQFVREVAEATQTPADIPALVALAVCGVPLARRYVVALGSNWSEPITLWTVAIAPPGRRKSAVFGLVTGPLRKLEREKADLSRDEIRTRASERKVAQKRIATLEARLAKESPNAENYEALRSELAEAITALNRLPELYPPTFIVDDITPESLVQEMARNNERLAIMSAEGGPFQMIGGTYSNGEPRLDVYLKGHSGDYVRTDRITRSTLALERPALTMAITPQPDVIADLGRKRELKGRGFLARNLYGFPSFPPKRDEELEPPPVSDQIAQAFDDVIRYLERRGAPLDTERRPLGIELTQEARALFLAFRAETNQSQTNGVLASHEEWAGKLAGAVGRIAAVLHAVVCARDHQAPELVRISADTMARATALARDYFVPHMVATFTYMQTDPVTELGKRIIGLLERDGRPIWKRQEIHTRLGRGVTAESLEPALNRLVDHGYLRRRQPADRIHKPGRKPGDLYEVNPAILRNLLNISLSGFFNDSLSSTGTIYAQPGFVPAPMECSANYANHSIDWSTSGEEDDHANF